MQLSRSLILAALSLVFVACRQTKRKVIPSFYYWKTVYAPTPKERSYLAQLSVHTLYVRLFDVGVDENGNPAPKGTLQWMQHPPEAIIPVLFFTQEVLRRIDTTGIDSLAARSARLAAGLCAGVQRAGEIQVDCDWSEGTRAVYFRLLEKLRAQPFFKGQKISATIRLHQLKFIRQNGIPPVDRGLLMCYNMGNLKNPRTVNSIIDPAELRKYTRGLHSYPLPLDIALPVFDWWVLFNGNQYKGIVYLQDSSLRNRSRLDFTSDTSFGGYAFRKGEWLRHERSDAASVNEVAAHIAPQLSDAALSVILFHLDESNLAVYSPDELQNFYRVFGHVPARPAARKRR